MQYMLLIYSEEGAGPQPGTEEFGPFMKGYMDFTEEVKANGCFVAGDALQDTATAGGGKFYEAVKNHDVDINAPHGLQPGQAVENPNEGWIQSYANMHLSQIALKKEKDGEVCATCKLVFREK